MQELCFMSYLTAAEWAAWVQAIGSVLAIAAAIVIARQQFAAAARLQREAVVAERTRKYEALSGFVEQAIEEHRGAVTALRSEDPGQYFDENSVLELMDDLNQAMKQVSPLDMPTASGAKAVITLRDHFAASKWSAGVCFDKSHTLYTEYALCADAIEENLKVIERTRDLLLGELRR